MTEIQFCPHCKASLTLKSILARACPECGTKLPARMRREEQHAMRPAMPVAMLIGSWLSMFLGGALAVMAVLETACAMDTYSIGDREVRREVFLEETQLQRLSFVVLGIGLLVIAWAIRARKSWSRIAIMGFWLVYLVLMFSMMPNTAPNTLAATFIPWIIYSGVAAWYFFAKRNVAAYFRNLAAAEH